jgi:hypothetical protein
MHRYMILLMTNANRTVASVHILNTSTINETETNTTRPPGTHYSSLKLNASSSFWYFAEAK